MFLAARLRVRILLTCAARVRVGFMAANMLLGPAAAERVPVFGAKLVGCRNASREALQSAIAATGREPRALDRGEELASGP